MPVQINVKTAQCHTNFQSSFCDDNSFTRSQQTIYRPAHTKIAGSCSAGLILSQLVYWHKTMYESNPEEFTRRQFWFHKTVEDLAIEAGIARTTAGNALEKLKDAGVIERDARTSGRHNPLGWIRMNLPVYFCKMDEYENSVSDIKERIAEIKKCYRISFSCLTNAPWHDDTKQLSQDTHSDMNHVQLTETLVDRLFHSKLAKKDHTPRPDSGIRNDVSQATPFRQPNPTQSTETPVDSGISNDVSHEKNDVSHEKNDVSQTSPFIQRIQTDKFVNNSFKSGCAETEVPQSSDDGETEPDLCQLDLKEQNQLQRHLPPVERRYGFMLRTRDEIVSDLQNRSYDLPVDLGYDSRKSAIESYVDWCLSRSIMPGREGMEKRVVGCFNKREYEKKMAELLRIQRDCKLRSVEAYTDIKLDKLDDMELKLFDGYARGNYQEACRMTGRPYTEEYRRRDEAMKASRDQQSSATGTGRVDVASLFTPLLTDNRSCDEQWD